MNDGSYVNMIIKNYNSEEVYSMEELEKSKQKSADHEDEEVCCCGHHHHHEEHDDGHEEGRRNCSARSALSEVRT